MIHKEITFNLLNLFKIINNKHLIILKKNNNGIQYMYIY